MYALSQDGSICGITNFEAQCPKGSLSCRNCLPLLNHASTWYLMMYILLRQGLVRSLLQRGLGVCQQITRDCSHSNKVLVKCCWACCQHVVFCMPVITIESPLLQVLYVFHCHADWLLAGVTARCTFYSVSCKGLNAQ